jgi:ribosome-binding protein aMBF1 (putative translation factor)
MDLKDILYEKKYNKEEFLKRINDAIKEKHLVQRQLAKKLDVMPQNFWSFLNGRLPMSPEKIKDLTEMIGI